MKADLQTQNSSHSIKVKNGLVKNSSHSIKVKNSSHSIKVKNGLVKIYMAAAKYEKIPMRHKKLKYIRPKG